MRTATTGSARRRCRATPQPCGVFLSRCAIPSHLLCHALIARTAPGPARSERILATRTAASAWSRAVTIATSSSGPGVQCATTVRVALGRKPTPNRTRADRTSTSPAGSQWTQLAQCSGSHDGPIYSVHWCAGRGYFATGAGDDAIRVFAPTPGKSGAFELSAAATSAHRFA